MISTDSRYVGATIVVEEHDVTAVVNGVETKVRRTTTHTRRNFPNPIQAHDLYTWKETDRLDNVAAALLGDARLWWRILDINPIIQDPHDIRPGEQIRIPRNA